MLIIFSSIRHVIWDGVDQLWNVLQVAWGFEQYWIIRINWLKYFILYWKKLFFATDMVVAILHRFCPGHFICESFFVTEDRIDKYLCQAFDTVFYYGIVSIFCHNTHIAKPITNINKFFKKIVMTFFHRASLPNVKKNTNYFFHE